MKKVLVLGCTGMLGHMVRNVLSRDADLLVEGTRRGLVSEALGFDAEHGRKGLRALLEQRGRYAYIINCIGLTKAKITPSDPDSIRQAILVNAFFPHELWHFAQESGARVIHISTDGVFSGAAPSYSEDAQHDCMDVYGKTKSLGEVWRPDVLTFRCSIVGPDPVGKSGLLEWFLGQPDGKELGGFTDHMWNGVTTLQFAELCHKIIAQDRFKAIWDESPVHHFCPNRPVSKYELLKIFQSVYKKHVTITPSSGPQPPARLILVTKYRSLTGMFGHELSIEHAVKELAERG